MRAMWPENRLALILCELTGLHLTQVLVLKPENLDGDYLRAFGHRYWLPEAVRSALRRISSKYYIFPHRDYADRHRTRQAVYKDIKRAKRDIGSSELVSPLICSRMSRMYMPL